MSEKQTVAVLGASHNPERYSNRAVRTLKEKGHRVIPIHPKVESIEGLPVINQLSDITEPVDTLTLYVGSKRLQPMIDDIIALRPGRVIFNPGTESQALQKKLAESGIPYLEACTILLLQTHQF
ncbi:CoA-binding protein [bacterium]|nr:CoA-binding protein [bacterium]